MQKYMLFTIIFLLFSCSDKTVYTVEGVLADNSLDGEVIYIYESSDPKQLANHTIIDSAIVTKNKYTFSGNLNVPNTVRYLKLKNDQIFPPFTIYIESGVALTVKYTNKDNFGEYTFSGSELNEKIREIRQEKDKEKAIKEMYDFADKYIETEAGTEFFLTKGIMFGVHYGEVELIEKYLPRINAKYKDDFRVTHTLELLPKLALTKNGSDFLDISGENLIGQKISLSDHVGNRKYTLCYFTASWCRPCMIRMPDLMQLYEKYKLKDLEIFFIALDKKEKWENVVEDYKITAPNIVIDDGGLSGKTVNEYGITGVPYSLLIDSKGKIEAKNLGLEELEAKLR